MRVQLVKLYMIADSVGVKRRWKAVYRDDMIIRTGIVYAPVIRISKGQTFLRIYMQLRYGYIDIDVEFLAHVSKKSM